MIIFFLILYKKNQYTDPSIIQIQSKFAIFIVFLRALSKFEPPKGFICVINILASSILFQNFKTKYQEKNKEIINLKNCHNLTFYDVYLLMYHPIAHKLLYRNLKNKIVFFSITVR
jgi:hypothetical protein